MNNDNMDQQRKISDAVVRRLPKYYRQLCVLQAQGVIRISSKKLGDRLEVKASQIRQDLNSFGGFGQQGYGYPVGELKDHIAQILSIDSKWKMIIVGAGNIGRALSKYTEFSEEGFEIVALFDNNEQVVGETIGLVQVHHTDGLESYVAENKVDILALAVPSQAVDHLMQMAENTGIGAVWNFTPSDVFSDSVVVENIHLTDSLMALSFRLGEKNKA